MIIRADREFRKFKKKVLDSDVLISSELLIGWNPRDWEEYAEKNLEIFGEDATIFIFIRDAASYLTEVYRQKVSEGLIQTPSDFFVSSEEYEKLKDFMSKIGVL
ncbi:hypothetical protein [Pseudopelagicola sp. nBUS_19]|uniref:hypothetical protein n=1 Tax=Pseudopelagicola sp. nBUS_19 TaxID=3395316 RepID=UPI003EBF6ACD